MNNECVVQSTELECSSLTVRPWYQNEIINLLSYLVLNGGTN